jgi:hypothetical protein
VDGDWGNTMWRWQTRQNRIGFHRRMRDQVNAPT